MAFLKPWNVVTVASTALLLLLGQTATTTVEACSCADLSLCETFEGADVVLRGTVLPRPRRHRRRRHNRPRQEGRVRYTLEVTAIYKGEPDVTDAQEITFTTEDDSADCGVTLNEGEEYLVDLYQTDDGLTAGLCGLVSEWNSVSDEDKASVEAGCEEDPCDVDCSEFQECLLYGADQYYCAAVCEPSPCAEDEVCSLQDIVCIRDPCPPIATCSPSSP